MEYVPPGSQTRFAGNPLFSHDSHHIWWLSTINNHYQLLYYSKHYWPLLDTIYHYQPLY